MTTTEQTRPQFEVVHEPKGGQFAFVKTGTLRGLDAQPVTVEVDISAGLPNLTIVGLPDTSLTESKERIKAALKNSGFNFPMRKVIINLAPADLRKEGTGFDLPLCVAILLASGTLAPTRWLESTCFIGEVSLEGGLRRVNGILSMALMAKEYGYQSLVVPEENVAEAALVEGVTVYGIKRLDELPILFMHPASFLMELDRQALMDNAAPLLRPEIDFSDIKGQEAAKRALEIAAAGGHNVLMMGAPGSGKSMLSKALPGILPPLCFDEMLEVSRIYSVAGLLPPTTREVSFKQLMRNRPFRSPHHTATRAGLTGGGASPKPGEITLAHRGVLFLDEFAEFPRHVLEILRQPLEDGTVTISRAQQNLTYPAQFMLLAALNPCPCGYAGDKLKPCVCGEARVARYMHRLSGPLLDRIDIHLEIARLHEDELLSQQSTAESSDTVRQRVLAAREIQTQRFKESKIYCNAEMSPQHLNQFCKLDEAGQGLMQKAIRKYHLSARTFDRVLRMARTIADLNVSESIQTSHLAEALQYRGLQKQVKTP
jgi:magnesium chelatase family protein